MNIPDKLNLGDTIGIIAPCSPVNPERAKKCEEYLKQLGYRVIMGESTKLSLHGYLAGSDEIRANDINFMFANHHIKAIVCIRGGYGGNRIMNLLDYEMIQRHPKIFVGYSDITSFHLAFHKLCSMVTYHGPMVSSNMLEDFDSFTKESFFQTINMEESLTLKNPDNEPFKVLKPGKANGIIIGGCLSLVSPAIGTYYQPDFINKILFLEDVTESLPRCDKMINHLFHSGIMDMISGLILGDFKDCVNTEDESYTMEDFFNDQFRYYDKPVMYHIKSGHCKPMSTIPFGLNCSMDTEKKEIRFHR